MLLQFCLLVGLLLLAAVVRPFLHEAAHFLAARCKGLHPVAVQVGTGPGKGLSWFRPYGAEVIVGWRSFRGFGGKVSFNPPLPSEAAPGTALLVACAGPGSDFLLGVVVLVTGLCCGVDTIPALLSPIPLWIGAGANLRPWVEGSDGAVACRAWKHLRRRRENTPLPATAA